MMPENQCLPREKLKAYLAGWSDPDQSDTIESHLSECERCEQTVVELERDPDTLIEFARLGAKKPAQVDSALASVLSGARRLPADSGEGESTRAWEPPSTDFGAYELLEPLGRGGMGAVYLARHRQLGKQVAIKLLPAGPFRNDHFAVRFQREVRAAGGLDHPSIVRATDAGEMDGTHYLVMEHIEGLDLSRLARLVGKLTIADACEITRHVALGLSHAHAAGIVHRDIKPSNLMLSTAGQVKILDFGLARVGPWDEVSAELTTVGQLMGTLDYMAPEQAERADAVDYRADLYSLGATLFRLLCGRAPLAASPDLSPLAKLRLLATHQPLQLDTLRTDAPPGLVALVASLLAQDPCERPASAAHVAEQLQPFSEGADLVGLVAKGQSVHGAESDPVSLPDQAWEWRRSISAAASKASTGWRWFVAAALLPVLFLGGVLITLEMQKGVLVVESEVGNISVQLHRDGRFYQELKIVPGANTTRLFGGKYQVVVDQGSDAVHVEDGNLVIKRGQTEIAHVRRAGSGSATAAGNLPASDAALVPGDLLRLDGGPGLEDIDFDFIVQGDSSAKLPLVGTVSVAGQTVDSLEGKLRERYREFYNDPHIQVFRRELSHAMDDVAARAFRAEPIEIPPPSDARLQPGDALQIRCWTDATFDSTVVVQQDLTIKAPLVGTVSVQEKTLSQFELALKELYAPFLRDPEIEVFRDFRMRSVDRRPQAALPPEQVALLERVLDQFAASASADDKPGLAQAQALLEDISHHIDSADVELDPAVGVPSRLPEPLYDGRPLSDWLNVVVRERSPQALGEALQALRALASEATAEQVTDVLLKALPRMNGNTKVLVGNSRGTLDREIFLVLQQAHPGEAFAALLVKELEHADPGWRKRLIDKAYYAEENFEPLVAWMEEHVLKPGDDPELVEDCGIFVVSAINEWATPDQQQMLLERLDGYRSLGPEFWLQFYPESGRYCDLMVKRVYQSAVEALIDPQASPKLVAQAAMTVKLLVTQEDIRQETRSNGKLIAALRERVHGATLEQLVHIVEVDDSFAKATFQFNNSQAAPTIRVHTSGRGSFPAAYVTACCPALKLLELAELLEVDGFSETLMEILTSTQGAYEKVNSVLPRQSKVSIIWPKAKAGVYQPTSSQLLGADPQEWAAFFIHRQAAQMLPALTEDADSGGSKGAER